MIVEYIRYALTAEATEFERAYQQAQEFLEESPHCLSWELSRCHEEPTSFILRIEWDSLDGHLKGFRSSAEFRRFFEHVKPYVDQIQEMRPYQPVLTSETIYDAMGGAETFFRLARAMHEAMKSDDLLGPKFAHAAPTHVPHLAMWLCEVFGGPKLYSAIYDDIGLILARHGNQDIRVDERERFASIVKQAARDCAPDGAERAPSDRLAMRLGVQSLYLRERWRRGGAGLSTGQLAGGRVLATAPAPR